MVFDIGGVFLVPHHRVVGEHLRNAGLAAPSGPQHYLRAYHRGVAALSAGSEHDESDPAFWRAYHRAYVTSPGVEEAGVEEAGVEEARRALGRLFASGMRIWHQRIEVNVDSAPSLR